MKKATAIVLLFGLSLISFTISAQDSFDPDILYAEARVLIMDGKYPEGREILFRAIEKYPNYADLLILVGRSYAWEGKNDSAAIYLDRAILASPTYTDAYAANLDNLFWADSLDRAEKVLAIAKEKFEEKLPNEIAYRESRLFYYRENYDEAYAQVMKLFEKGYKREGLLGYMQNLQRLRRNNAIGATFDYDSFRGELSPWQTWSAYARTRTDLTGSLIARVTQSSRFDGFGTLYELDAYPSLGKNSYAYLNIGGSGASFFPQFRFGGSIYFNLKNAWEIDGGYRYLNFGTVTNIYTASVGKYVSSWWLNLRLNVIPTGTGGVSTSGIFQARYYFKSAEDFFSIQLSTGVSPDEENRDLSQLLNSYRFRFGYQQLITDRFMLFGYSGYSWDELAADRIRNNFNVSIGAEYRF